MGDDQSELHHVTRADQLAIRRLFSHLPDSFTDKNEALLELRTLFHEEMASALEPHLRTHLKAQPQETMFERDGLTMKLGNLLNNLGLTLQCPETHRAVQLELEADVQQRDASQRRRRPAKQDTLPESERTAHGMRYVLSYQHPLDSKKYVSTLRSDELPQIFVRAKPPDFESRLPVWSKDTNSPAKGR